MDTPPRSALPVDAVVPEVVAALETVGAVVLDAPPGAGKTTRVPLALLDHDVARRRLVLLEPRRVAARAAAARLASQLGETVGRTVGLTTRDERRTSPDTRIEVVTEGVLLRRLQRDPELSGIDVLFFDEFHERNLEADLALAFAVETRAALRPDLRLLVGSATLATDRVAGLLGGAPVVRADVRRYPVEVEHRPSPSPQQLADAVVAAVVDLMEETTGDVLVFLPGAREIRRAVDRLDAVLGQRVAILPLHGSLPARDQDAAIRPAADGRRKVIVSTDLAESSLTIDGVDAVVDAGRSREPRFDPATGMTGLVTVAASRASAEQRTGRAGRTGPGRAIRLWPQREHAGRDPHPRPAILTDDLTGAALEVAAWGAHVTELPLLDRPPDAAWQRATQTLEQLGAVQDGLVTAHGRVLVGLPLHPRVGHLVVRGSELGLEPLACDLAAVLSDRDPFIIGPDAANADLEARIRALRGARPPAGIRLREGALRRARRESERIRRRLAAGRGSTGTSRSTPADQGSDDDVHQAGRIVALGWPERIASLRPGQRGSFLLAGGRGASLPDTDPLAGERWLAVAHLDRGETDARIHLAAALDPDLLRAAVEDAGSLEVIDEVAWRDGDVVAERREEYGALVLSRVRLSEPDPQPVLDALLTGLRTEGLGLLARSREDTQFQARVALVRDASGDEAWPDLADERLLADADVVIAPFLLAARRRADLSTVRFSEVLRSLLASKQLRDLERLAPTHLDVPSGNRVRLDYTGERPVLAVKVQEMFGAVRTPTVVDGRVPVLLHLLSPARRPVQVTDDLAGFWERGYPQVRSELRGRYPKHPWPEDPTTASPTARTSRRR